MKRRVPSGVRRFCFFMQFNRKTIQHYQQGDSKEVIRFAWLPVKIDSKWLWLESYTTLYVFTINTIEATVNGEKGKITYSYWQKTNSKPLKERKK